MLRYAGRCRLQPGVVAPSGRTAKRSLAKRASAVPRSSQMVTQRPLLLVHGNFSQAWTWNDLKARLIDRGYSVFTLDLQWQRKSNGELPGLQDHALQIADRIKHEGLRDVVLVGHSYGGVPVLQAAADLPDQVSAAVFMNTHILQNNQSIADQVPAKTTQLIQQEAAKNDGYWFRDIVTFEKVKQGFFPHMTEDEAREMYDRMHPEPTTVWTDKVKLPTNFTSLPCHYILFTDDQAIYPGYGREMARKLQSMLPTQVHEMPGHHFGFMERPEEVIDILDKALK